MRVKVDCADCGPVALPPKDITLVRTTEEPSDGLFDCPICRRVRAVPVAKHALPVLIASGAVETTDATDPHAPLGLADLRRLQALLQDDEACRQMLGGAL